MAVYCQQLIDGEAIDPEWEIEPAGVFDRDLLLIKAASAAEKEWDVEWLGSTEFVARKVRWSDPPALCERIFRVGP